MSTLLTTKKGDLSVPILAHDYPKLSFEEEAALLERAKHDDIARTEVLDRYLKMLFNIAQHYMIPTEKGYRSKIEKLPEVDDIASEGLIPLSKSINDYSPATGYKFITFAERYVRQHLDNLLRDQNYLLERSPRHIEVEVPKSVKDIQKEIAEGKTMDEIKETKTIKVPDQPISLETEVAKGDDSFKKLIDTIQDTKADSSTALELESFIEVVLSRLPDELSRKILLALISRAGEKSLKMNIAKELNLSPSMISAVIADRILPVVNEVRLEEGKEIITKDEPKENGRTEEPTEQKAAE